MDAIPYIKRLAILFCCQFLFACPSDDGECDIGNRGKSNSGPLGTISPLQDVYNIGDIIELEISIPNTNTFFDRPVDMREATQLDFGRIGFSSSELFDGNIVNPIIGSAERITTYSVPYVAQSDSYELLLEIQLTKAGNYDWFSASTFTIVPNPCVSFVLDTFVQSTSNDREVSFVVQ